MRKGQTCPLDVRARISAKMAGRPWSPQAYRRQFEVMAKTYVVTDPDGNTETVTGLTRFCKTRGLSASHMAGVATGRLRHHRGWRCRHKGIS